MQGVLTAALCFNCFVPTSTLQKYETDDLIHSGRVCTHHMFSGPYLCSVPFYGDVRIHIAELFTLRINFLAK